MAYRRHCQWNQSTNEDGVAYNWRWFPFSVSDVLWLTVAVAAFFGGMHLQLKIGEPFIIARKGEGAWMRRANGKTREGSWKKVTLADGTEWFRAEGDLPDERTWLGMTDEDRYRTLPPPTDD